MANPYFSEVKYLGNKTQDFIEIAVDSGTNVAGLSVTVYRPDGTVRSTDSLGTPVNTQFGKDIYVIKLSPTTNFQGLGKFGAVALDDGGTVLSFLSFNDNAAAVTATQGAAAGLTSTDIGQAGAGQSLETTDGGTTYYTTATPNEGQIPACFVTGTLILTPEGEIPVEQLQAGDLVITRDHGTQTIRWAGRQEMGPDCPSASAPIRIKAHTFGHGTPAQDLLVSPFHRLLIEDYRCDLFFGCSEMLVAAAYLQDDQKITQARMTGPFAYYHLLFDRHEVVYSNGMASESFHPHDTAVDSFSKESREELLALFPALATIPDTPASLPARPVLTAAEATLLFQNV